MMNEEKTKSFAVSKQMVYDSYLKVCDKTGGAGVDKETIEKFNENLSGGNKAVLEKYQTIVQSNGDLFIHWQKGIKY